MSSEFFCLSKTLMMRRKMRELTVFLIVTNALISIALIYADMNTQPAFLTIIDSSLVERIC